MRASIHCCRARAQCDAGGALKNEATAASLRPWDQSVCSTSCCSRSAKESSVWHLHSQYGPPQYRPATTRSRGGPISSSFQRHCRWTCFVEVQTSFSLENRQQPRYASLHIPATHRQVIPRIRGLRAACVEIERLKVAKDSLDAQEKLLLG